MNGPAEQVAAVLRLAGFAEVVAVGLRGYGRALTGAGHRVPREVADLLAALNRDDRRGQTVLDPDLPGDDRVVLHLLARPDAAALLRISVRSLDRRVREGSITCRHVGRRVLFDVDDLRAVGGAA